MSTPAFETERPSTHTRRKELERNFASTDHTMTDKDRLMKDTSASDSPQWAQSGAVPEINAELAALSDVPAGDVRDALLRELRTFGMEAKNEIGGSPGHSKFQRCWIDLRLQFRDRISCMEPLIMLCDAETEYTTIPPSAKKRGLPDTSTYGPRSPVYIDLESSDDDDRTPKSELAAPVFTYGALPPRTSYKHERSESSDEPSNQKFFEEGPDSAVCNPRTFTLDEIRYTIQRISWDNFPGEIDPQVMVDLSKKALEPWKVPLEILTRTIMTLTYEAISAILAKVLSRFAQTDLYTQAMNYIRVFFDDIEMRQRERLDTLLELELLEPMTLNKEAFNKHRIESLESIQQARHNVRVKALLNRQENITRKHTYSKARRNKAAKVTPEELGPDSFCTEVVIMSKVKAYYRTAYPRFVDNILGSLQTHMFKEVKTELQGSLENSFEVRTAKRRSSGNMSTLRGRLPDTLIARPASIG